MRSQWQTETEASLLLVKDSLVSAARDYSTASAAAANASRSHRTYRESLKQLATVYGSSRDVIRKISLRKLTAEVAFSSDYLQRRLNARGLGESLKLSEGGAAFEVVQPLQLVTEATRTSICAQIAHDQFGLTANCLLSLDGKTHKLKLFVGLAFAPENSTLRVFISHAPKLFRPPKLKDRRLISFLEGLIYERINNFLAGNPLPPIETGPMEADGFRTSIMTCRITNHTSLFCNIAPAGGNPWRTDLPLLPLDRMPPKRDALFRISTDVLLKMFIRMIYDFANKNQVHVQDLQGKVLPDPWAPDPQASSRKVLAVEWLAVCVNDFGEQEDQGLQQFFASVEKIVNDNETRIVLKLSYAGALLKSLLDKVNWLLPRPVLMKVDSADEVETALDDDVLTIGINYHS